MKLMAWIGISAIISLIAISGGTIGLVILASIILGVLFRSFTLLLEIKNRLSQITENPNPKVDPVKDAFEKYLNEKNTALKGE
ncbi:hypothetical protein [Sutcliffiella rhizosphaerae]|uniref:Uncharacterized protein n=1 Tax=Sutcliffiella rhizosphaerae TaxID=2880967 RepID=A0ABN8ABK0_9BACI|nr:hypothetical protein [Sutcliffiella rhizosphaerae]CAG9621566.1 hypothetical protein BACCIP111883_02339 [Sutcliffiella rhizosphaerae]